MRKYLSILNVKNAHTKAGNFFPTSSTSLTNAKSTFKNQNRKTFVVCKIHTCHVTTQITYALVLTVLELLLSELHCLTMPKDKLFSK